MSIAKLRKEYRLAALTESDVAADPIRQFDKWLSEAIVASLPEPTAMTLATVSESGRPSARIVLLKGCDPRGFLFFTNYQSRKGEELQKNPWASLVFYWIELERQVRIEGRVETASPAESDEYHASRPRLSQLGVWASPQSKLIEDRQWLERRFADAAQRFPGEAPRPDYWGGYRLIADAIEFWQGRESRLHDRILYRLQQDGTWLVARLAP